MSYQLRQGTSFHLLRCAGRLKQQLEQALRPHDVTPVQFAVLGLLWESDDLLQHEIADQLGKDRPNISRVVKKMAQKGLIECHKATEDRRATRIYLTRQGQQLRSVLEPFAVDFRTQLNQGLSASEQRQLISLMNKLMDNLA